MAFCRKCGAVMDEDDAFCSKCGASVASTIPQAAPVVPVAQPVQAAPAAQAVPVAQPAPYAQAPARRPTAAEVAYAREQHKNGMSKGELLQVLQRYRDVLREIETFETETSSASDSASSNTPVRYHTFIKFYWPFIVLSVVAFWVIYFIGARVAVMTLSIKALYIGLIIASIAALSSILGGIGIAKSRQSTANYYAYETAHKRDSNRRSRTDVSIEKKKIESRVRSIEKELPDAITVKYRTYDNICTLVRLLKFDKAKDLEEALRMTDEEILKKRL